MPNVPNPYDSSRVESDPARPGRRRGLWGLMWRAMLAIVAGQLALFLFSLLIYPALEEGGTPIMLGVLLIVVWCVYQRLRRLLKDARQQDRDTASQRH